MDINSFIKKNHTKSYAEVAQLLNEKGVKMKEDAIRKRAKKMGLPPKKINAQNKPLSPEQEIERDLRLTHITEGKRQTDAKYKIMQKMLREAEEARDLVKQIEEVTTYTIKPTKGAKSEATAIVLASDFHNEEVVRADAIDGLNEFNLAIAETRINRFFTSVAKLVQVKQQAIPVKTLVLALLGDFITGNIHEEIDTALDPAEAVINVQNHLASGIEYLLRETDVEIVLPCHSGNHGRATKTIHQGNEHANSHEYLMYHNLANYFRNEKRVKFLIAKGYHSYLDVSGFRVRFHHGHNLKYNGGVGGIFIPTRKAIAQWNKARPVDLDCFGHFHQLLYGGNFVCNGSLIGYNAYALSIKADYEKPKQAFFLINHVRKEVTDFSPVWLD
jgi:hypothetical protein